MAMNKSKSSLAGKLGAKGAKAFDQHKSDETEFDAGGRLPAGIENGIAQLSTCKFGVYEKGDNKGEYFFMAAGIVTEPKVQDGIPIEGLRTQIGPEPICDTPKASKKKMMADHWAWVLNELRKLGLETEGLTIEEIESAVAELEKDAPFFRFRTWKGQASKQYPNPRLNEVWGGVVEHEDKEEDDTEEAEADEEAEEEATDELPEDLLELGAIADDPEHPLEDEAGIKLTALAKPHKINVKTAKNWLAVAKALAKLEEADVEDEDEPDDDAAEEEDEAEEGEEAEEETEDEEAAEEFVPEVEQCFKYKPKGMKKAVDVEVMSVQAKAKTVTLKNMGDGKTLYPKVAWTALEDAE